ncbi:putative RNA polymerase sigma factor FecI [Thalassocella blandensis]|nr:putative RNA polymerase sigma factor FecI [Thalassocella blandensis]
MSSRELLSQEFINYQLTLKKVVSRLVPMKDVDDIVHDTYIRACQTNYEIYHPKSFLVKIARNLAVDHIKRAEYRLCDSIFNEDGELVFEALKSDEDATVKSTISSERYEKFCEAIGTLPKQCQKAFVMKKVYGYSQKEIAKEMGIGESSVEKHIANGLKRCRKHMEHRPQRTVRNHQ